MLLEGSEPTRSSPEEIPESSRKIFDEWLLEDDPHPVSKNSKGGFGSKVTTVKTHGTEEDVSRDRKFKTVNVMNEVTET